jgi:HNH endonuclease
MRKNQAADFWARVDVWSEWGRSGCWLWEGARDDHGYGTMWYHGQQWRAHRLSYALNVGPIPTNLLVCHHCDTPLCVKPSHLFVGTDADNAHDREAKGRTSPARGLAHGRYTKPECTARGERVGTAKLTAQAVIDIRRRYRRGLATSLGREFGVTKQAINYVVAGTTWT